MGNLRNKRNLNKKNILKQMRNSVKINFAKDRGCKRTQSDSSASAEMQNNQSIEGAQMVSPFHLFSIERDADNKKHDNSISGHRIIDIKHFFQSLVDISSHVSLFECGLHTMEIKSERQCAFTSHFLLRCKMCNQEFEIVNSMEKLNKCAVGGAISAGCGHTQLKQFSAALDLPLMSTYTYNIAQDEVFDEWEVTAWEEMKKAGVREREAALKEGRIDKNGTPMIDVVLDGCWSKRSYRTNYSALSGAAAIIGKRFGQVLFLAVKNKYCCICARAEKRKETVKQHECYRNFSDSSTAMESAIIAEGFKLSMEMHGLIYAKFVADGDSSTYAKILETRPYSSITVEKVGCKNHILRNFCTKLQLLSNNKNFDRQERLLLTKTSLMSVRKYICDAIKYHGSRFPKIPKSECIRNLHKDITNSIYHGFRFHKNCNQDICSEKPGTSSAPNINSNSHLFRQIRSLVGNVSSQARSLIENTDSNVVERFNGVIAKFAGGKRVNYSLKRSYQARCAGAVISFNSGKVSTTVENTIHDKSPLAKMKKYECDVENKRLYNLTLKRKKNRRLFPKKIDLNYGENVYKPDMDQHIFELTKQEFLKNLKKTPDERHEIEQRTILQSDSGEWLELRRNLLTASNFGNIIKRRKTVSCQNAVKNMLYKPNLDHVSSISHGKKHEKVALEQLSDLMEIDIKQCGLFIDEKHPCLGATPDGVSDDMLIEIKCPVVPFKIGIDAAIQQGKMHFWKTDKKTGAIHVNNNSDWFFQVQGQMHICQKSQCLVAVWYGEYKFKTEMIKKDDQFWTQKMEPQLLSFYYDCLLPELVDPRYTRHQPIRDPRYVVPKNKVSKSKEQNA